MAGRSGDQVVRLAAQAIRGVALGVVVTAVVQAALAGVGLVVAGVPSAALLAAVTFVLCIAQLGPLLVLGPSVAWLYWQGATGTATALMVWTLVVLTLDNVLRPFLMTKGADLPMLLMLAGVIGGLLAFGLIGIFVGPVVLGVSYTLLAAWVGNEPDAPAAPMRCAARRPRRPERRGRRLVGGWRQLEAATEREVEIHPLHALLGLHRISAERVAVNASCRCSTNLRSVLPTLNWVCTTSSAC